MNECEALPGTIAPAAHRASSTNAALLYRSLSMCTSAAGRLDTWGRARNAGSVS